MLNIMFNNLKSLSICVCVCIQFISLCRILFDAFIAIISVAGKTENGKTSIKIIIKIIKLII